MFFFVDFVIRILIIIIIFNVLIIIIIMILLIIIFLIISKYNWVEIRGYKYLLIWFLEYVKYILKLIVLL